MGLGDVLGALVTERAWEIPAAGATLRERSAAIAPELAGHVAAVGYDAESGRLTVRPESTAWATKTRLEHARVIAAANKAAGRTVVSSLRILPSGAVPVSELADVAPTAPAAATSRRLTGRTERRASTVVGRSPLQRLFRRMRPLGSRRPAPSAVGRPRLPRPPHYDEPEPSAPTGNPRLRSRCRTQRHCGPPHEHSREAADMDGRPGAKGWPVCVARPTTRRGTHVRCAG
ncbi:DUF721 domain-containing protein [Streptomyces sp. NPDC003710]